MTNHSNAENMSEFSSITAGSELADELYSGSGVGLRLEDEEDEIRRIDDDNWCIEVDNGCDEESCLPVELPNGAVDDEEDEDDEDEG